MIYDANSRIYRGNLHLAHIDRSPGRGPTSLPSSLACLFVCGKVEGDEEKKVGAQDAHACECGKLLAGASAVAREVGKVGRGEVCVGGEVNES